MLQLALACLFALLAKPTDPPGGDGQSETITAFVDVTVIPMDRERRLPGHTVLVRGDRIVEVGPVARVQVPDGGVRVDGRGKFLIPGLAEMHAHIPGGQASDSVIERTLFMYVAGGITTVRGMLGHSRHLELRARAARGERLSPTIYTSGPQSRAQWAEEKNGVLAETNSTPESARRMIEMRRRLIKALHSAGAGLLLGSDAPQIYNVPGFSTHRERESLVASGLTPYQALETGTRNVATYFGTQKETGTIEKGKRADLVLLDADPLADVRNTTRRSGVMMRGRWLPQAEIDRRLAEVAKAVGN